MTRIEEHNPSSYEGPALSLARLIAETDWEEMITRLLGYARRHLLRHRSSAASIADQADDLVQEAIKRFLDGTRKYDGKKPLFNWFCSLIDSVASHDREKKSRGGCVVSIDQPVQQGASESVGDGIASIEDVEQEIIARDKLRRFQSKLEPDLRRHVDQRVHGAQGAAEEHLVEVTAVEGYNLDRRLRRRREQWNEV